MQTNFENFCLYFLCLKFNFPQVRASANLDKINFKKDKIFLVLKFHFLEARAALANHGEERGVCRALKVTGKTRQGNVIKCFFAQNILRIKHIILHHKGSHLKTKKINCPWRGLDCNPTKLCRLAFDYHQFESQYHF